MMGLEGCKAYEKSGGDNIILRNNEMIRWQYKCIVIEHRLVISCSTSPSSLSRLVKDSLLTSD